ncbi:protein PHLOEM PROTEIN 2-LIKE A9-like isoform X2 [Pistacia vera]|uniref:protein PHLOEM PROTEIN 2-LIKE A9-like isoform X2 n=1 Tax=Pistacia vera TaxID=55513 RepID=UPI0012637F3D|nr:protein PHLOEM PROTEIN 2-LIKE A9-like isoform X2 [Pistacia vera]
MRSAQNGYQQIMPKGESSHEPTPALLEKQPEGDKGAEEKKPEKAETTEEDKDYKIYPGKLEITWGDNQSYWSSPNKTSKEPAELYKVSWLQVTGKTKVKRGKSYEIEFNITLKADGFGWNGLPLFLMAKIGAKGKSIWKKIKPLEQTPNDKTFDIPKPEEKFIVKIPDNKGDEEQDLFFGFYEIWSNKWKGGLLINYATVKEVSERN